MAKFLKLVLMFALIGIIAGCVCLHKSVRPKSPGQAVASENHYQNGVKQYEMGHYKQAIHQFEKAVQKDPTNYKAYFYLGLSHEGRGLLGKAQSFLEKALGLAGGDAAWTERIRAQLEALNKQQTKKEKPKGKDKNK